MVHEVLWVGGTLGHDDQLSEWNTQSSSQWDGFRHIRHPAHGFYNGVADEAHGVHHWAARGIVGRGVLADVGRHRVAEGRPLDMLASDPIDPEELSGTLERQGTTVTPGDILLVRTGWIEWYRELDEESRAALADRYRSPGLRAGEDMARLLWELRLAAVAADNPALEAWPPPGATSAERLGPGGVDPVAVMEGSLHFALLPLLGMPIGELWDMAALADDCAADGCYEFLLTSSPLHLVGGVGSPPNALAIK